MKRVLIYYPFLFCLYPILFHFQQNSGYLRLVDLLLPLACALAVTGLVWWAASRITRNADKAGVLTVFWGLWFFAYGHLVWYGDHDPHGLLAMYIRDTPHLFWGQGLLLGTLPLLLIRRLTPEVRAMFGIMGLLLIVPVSAQIGWAQLTRPQLHVEAPSKPLPPPAVESDDPDIYFIVIDTYARADILETCFHIDNAPFLAKLRRRGFTIADGSYANYGQTLLSIASSLNMEHMAQNTTLAGKPSPDIKPAVDMIKHSRVAALLKARGYAVLSLSEFWQTELENVDIGFRTGTERSKHVEIDPVPPFCKIVLDMTPLGPLTPQLSDWLDGEPEIDTSSEDDRKYLAMWKSRRKFFDLLGTMPRQDRPMFVFAHTLGLHAPLFFDRRGNLSDERPSFRWEPGILELNGTRQTLQEYEQRYADHLAAINTLTLRAVDTILNNATRPTVIILQGDHGPSGFHARTHGEAMALREQMAIFNACYFSDGPPRALYPEYSPVNTFRLLFNHYFGTEYPLLPDRSYFSTWDKPFVFTDVTETVRKAMP